MRQNYVKKEFALNARLPVLAKAAIESFASDDLQNLLKMLLGPTQEGVLRGKFLECQPEFQRFSLGTICVWSECWQVLQMCIKNEKSDQAYIGENTASLSEIRSSLKNHTRKSDLIGVQMEAEELRTIFLKLHIRLLLTVITNPRLQRILDNLLRSECDRRIEAQSWRSNANYILKDNFGVRQRQNIEDFIQHLEVFFQQSLKDQLKEQFADGKFYM